MIEGLQLVDADASTVLFLDGERTPAGLIRLACALHASAASLAEIRDTLTWFGVDRSRLAIRNWCHSFAESHEQQFTAEPDRVAVDEKQVQLAKEREVWLYAAIDIESNVVLHARLSEHRGTDPATSFLHELKEKHRVEDAEFLVDGMGYLTALARTEPTGHLDYSERNIVEKLFQTYTMRIGRFHETWNGSQPSVERWSDCLYGLLQPSSEPSSTGESTTDHSTRTDGFNLAVPFPTMFHPSEISRKSMLSYCSHSSRTLAPDLLELISTPPSGGGTLSGGAFRFAVPPSIHLGKKP